MIAYRGKLRFVGCNDDGFYLGVCEEGGKIVLCSFVASHDILLYPTTPSSAAE